MEKIELIKNLLQFEAGREPDKEWPESTPDDLYNHWQNGRAHGRKELAEELLKLL